MKKIKDKSVLLKMTENEYNTLSSAAKKDNLKLATYIRQKALEAAAGEVAGESKVVEKLFLKYLGEQLADQMTVFKDEMTKKVNKKIDEIMKKP